MLSGSWGWRAGSKKIHPDMHAFCKDLENMACNVVNGLRIVTLHDMPNLPNLNLCPPLFNGAARFLNLGTLKIKVGTHPLIMPKRELHWVALTWNRGCNIITHSLETSIIFVLQNNYRTRMANSALKCQMIILITARTFCSYNNILINFGHFNSMWISSTLGSEALYLSHILAPHKMTYFLPNWPCRYNILIIYY